MSADDRQELNHQNRSSMSAGRDDPYKYTPDTTTTLLGSDARDDNRVVKGQAITESTRNEYGGKTERRETFQKAGREMKLKYYEILKFDKKGKLIERVTRGPNGEEMS